MSASDLVVARSVDKHFLKFPRHIQKRVISAYDRIKANPLVGIKLEGQLSDYYKLRVGDYRIIYYFEPKKNLIVVVKLEHRQGVYK